MNTQFTLRGQGHRGRMLVHQLSLERPPRPNGKEAGIELIVLDCLDPRLEIELLAKSLIDTSSSKRRIALALMPNAVDLRKPPSPVWTIREHFDAWIPILPYEVTNPCQTGEFGFTKGYLPTLRNVYWRLNRMVQNDAAINFDDSDFDDFWSNGTTLWSFQVTSSGANRAEVAGQLLDGVASEPIFWNAESTRFMMKITSSSKVDHCLKMDEIIPISDGLNNHLGGATDKSKLLRWAMGHDDDLEDRMVIDVLAAGQALDLTASMKMLTSADRWS